MSDVAPVAERPALYPRFDETFPRLSPEEIARLRRFGAARSYRDGEALIEAGTPGPGMFIVLRGQVAISQRDGFGQRQPLVEQGPGQFIAEVGQLSGRLALVDGTAEGDVDTILIPPAGLRALLIAEATLGERITRALILRRVQLIQAGHGGPLVIGDPGRRRRAPARHLPQAQRASAQGRRTPRSIRRRRGCSRTAPPRPRCSRW